MPEGKSSERTALQGKQLSALLPLLLPAVVCTGHGIAKLRGSSTQCPPRKAPRTGQTEVPPPRESCCLEVCSATRTCPPPDARTVSEGTVWHSWGRGEGSPVRLRCEGQGEGPLIPSRV